MVDEVVAAPDAVVEDAHVVDENVVAEGEEVIAEGEEVVVDENAEGEVVAEGEGEVATDEEVEEAIQMIKELKLKVDGKEVIENLPFEVTPEQAEYLKKELQLSKMSQKRSQEAADLRKKDLKRDSELKEFLETLQNNPSNILEQMGIDVNKFAEEVMSREVEKMQMSDEERRIVELEEELRGIREKETEMEKAAEERESEALRDKYAAEYEKSLIEAIDENALPNSPYIVGKMINLVSTAHENGLDLDFKDVAGIVKEEYDTDMRSRINGLNADDLIKLLSDEARKDIVSKSIPKEAAKQKKVPTSLSDIKEGGSDIKDYVEKKFREESSENFFRKL